MRVLIIDDEPYIRQSLKAVLEDDGHLAEMAENGTHGLNLLAENEYDLVLLDVRMAGMDGLTVLNEIKKQEDSPAVVMISGDSGISEALAAGRAGALDFLEKPVSLPRLRLVLAKVEEYRALRSGLNAWHTTADSINQMIGQSAALQEVKRLVERVAPTNAKVLIRGETGTGKELIAWAIHRASPRANRQFVKFNSAAIPGELVESELFGYERGAFTGAVKAKRGKLEEADGGTLFLDEIGDMSLSAQAKILRVIQEGEFERVGSNRSRKIDARIIAATHKNLEEMVTAGTFREDLYHRLNVVPIVSPPLRQRTGDIPILLEHFCQLFARELKMPIKKFSPEAQTRLQNHPFTGNIRELKNLVERLYILTDGSVIKLTDLQMDKPATTVPVSTQDDFWQQTRPYRDKKLEFERRYLQTQLALYGSITACAIALGLQQGNLSRKLKELELNLVEE